VKQKKKKEEKEEDEEGYEEKEENEKCGKRKSVHGAEKGRIYEATNCDNIYNYK